MPSGSLRPKLADSFARTSMFLIVYLRALAVVALPCQRSQGSRALMLAIWAPAPLAVQDGVALASPHRDRSEANTVMSCNVRD